MVGILNIHQSISMTIDTERPAPSYVLDAERGMKRMRTRHHGTGRRQLYAEEAVTMTSDEEIFQVQLLRALSLELSAVGFQGATPEALEALRAEVEQCKVANYLL